MGCITKFVLSLLAFWGFSTLGWITITEGSSLFWIVFWAIIIMAVVDILTLLVNLLVQAIALPLSCLTVGLIALVIEGVFKYAGLSLASYLTSMFTLPWIFSEYWWQALIIGFVFAVIGMLTQSRSSSSSRISYRSSHRSSYRSSYRQ